MIRRARMQGKNAVWVPGMDHAGIATQNVVEKQLAEEGLTRHDLGREAFVARVWEWKEQYGGVILDQLRRLGASLDWEREAFTFDEPRSRAVREVFVGLHEQGLIYRGNRLINWCPRCATALSDIEVEHEEITGELVSFTLPVRPTRDGTDGITVATTRLETMLGDTAIAVHPDDERYRDVVGRAPSRHPFLDRDIPVDRRRLRRPRVRLRRGQDHAGPRPQRLRDRPAARPRADRRHDRRGDDQRGRRAATRAWTASRPARAISEAPRRARPAGEARGLRAPGRPLLALRHVVEPRLSDQWFLEVAPAGRQGRGGVRDGRDRACCPSASPPRSWTGSTTSTTGASRARSGGATASRPGTAPTGT